MKVLITGATGFIGSHLTESLHEKGYQLRCLIRKTSSLEWLKHLPIEYVYGDLFDEKVLQSVVQDVDYVYHLAGITKAKTKEEYFRGNHLATKNLLRAVLKFNPNVKRFVHISSQAAVGPSLNGKAVDEQTPFHPITTYGISKMEAEKECLQLMNKLPITITRPPAVYGPRDKDVFEFFNTMNKGLQPMIGFGKKYVSLVHVKSLVDGIILAGEHPKGVGQTYFISSEQFYHWKEIGELTASIMQKKVFRLKVPIWGVYVIGLFAEIFSKFSSKPALLNLEKVKDIIQDAWTCDISKAMNEVGYRESISLGKGIRETVEWYRTSGWLK
ncbi:MAG: NAD-dependent epimerase/dehydratase family protein [Ignavibacteriales bacterium]|nr:NAD-dependent epimerase/dehydratase family protein [Ignavibacteriales bacterium]